jgi:integrase
MLADFAAPSYVSVNSFRAREGRAGPDWLGLHDLRHGYATFILAAGVPSRAIMEVLGHSGVSVTMNTYAHVLPALRQEAADAIDELFGGS